MVGGYCEGARIAFLIAKRLTDLGHEVNLLCMQEQFVPEPYEGRVAMFFGAPGILSPYRYFSRPELGWLKFYTGQVAIERCSTPHNDFYLEPYIQDVAEQLNGAMAQAQRDTGASPPRSGASLQILPDEGYRAKLRLRVPRLLRPGAAETLSVEVTNVGAVTWLPTEASGITLGNRWLNLAGTVQTWLDGTVEVRQEIEPGETATIDLDITAPTRSGPWRLEVDLVDEGVAWFQDRGSRPARRTLVVAPALRRHGRGRER